MLSVLVATPSTGHPQIAYTQSVANLLLYFSQYQALEDEPEQSIEYYAVVGSGVSSNREHLARKMLEGDYTHILWWDEDNHIQPHGLNLLLSRRLPIVGCNYRMKRPNGDFMAVGEGEIGRIATTNETTGVQECVYAGFGFCLMERRVIQAVADVAATEGGMFPLGRMASENRYATEDLGFCMIARSQGYNYHVDHDASKLIGHMGPFNYTWRDRWE